MNVLVMIMQMMFYVCLYGYVTCYLHVNLLSIYAYSLLFIPCSVDKLARKSETVGGTLTLSVYHLGIMVCIF